MKYNIIAIGNIKKSPESMIIENISKRLKNKLVVKEFVSKLPPGNARKLDETKNLIKLISNNGQNILLEIGPFLLDRTGSVDRMGCVQNGQNGQRVLLLLELTLSLAMLPRID